MTRTALLPLPLLLLWLAPPALAQDAAKRKATTWEERLEAKDPEGAREVQRVRGDATVSTSVRPRQVDAHPRVYRHLLEHLPQASRWLAALELGDYDIRDLPEGRFKIDDKAGAKAIGERALSEPTLLCVVARGSLEVPVLPRIEGAGVILVRFPQVTCERTKRRLLRCEAEVAFRVESDVLHGLSRPFRRLLARVLRQKLAQLVRSATELAEQIHKSPTAVYRRLVAAKVGAKDLQAFRRAFLTL